MDMKSITSNVILVLIVILGFTRNAVSQTVIPVFIQPLPIYCSQSDFHVMFYFQDHPEYESVEALIKENPDGEPFVRAIVTRHDQTQMDYVNDKKAIDNANDRGTGREIHFAQIEYLRKNNGKEPSVFLRFTTNQNEEIIFDFKGASRPGSKYGGLIDPERHSENSALPIMYRERSALAHPDSTISINGTKYEIPVYKEFPPFFKGMKGFYSEDFSMGVIYAGTKVIKCLESPIELSVGRKWVYEVNRNQKINYEIREKKNKECLIISKNEAVSAEIDEGNLKIRQIKISSDTEDKSGGFEIKFVPSLSFFPFASEDDSKEVKFSIAVQGHKSLVKGIVKTSKEKIKLVPTEPEWAGQRIVTILFQKNDGELTLKTEVGKE